MDYIRDAFGFKTTEAQASGAGTVGTAAAVTPLASSSTVDKDWVAVSADGKTEDLRTQEVTAEVAIRRVQMLEEAEAAAEERARVAERQLAEVKTQQKTYSDAARIGIQREQARATEKDARQSSKHQSKRVSKGVRMGR